MRLAQKSHTIGTAIDERRDPQARRRLARLLWFTTCASVITVSLSPDLTAERKSAARIGLDLVYQVTMPANWKGQLKALLDTDSKYLYIAASSEGKLRLRILNWGTDKVVREADYSQWNCGSDNISVWDWVQGRPYIHLRYCRSEYLLDATSLAVVRRIGDVHRSGEGAVFSATGDVVLVSTFDVAEGKLKRALHRVADWSKIGNWDHPGVGPAFTLDGRYIVVEDVRSGPWKGPTSTVNRVLECGLSVYEVATGNRLAHWMTSPDEGQCLGGSLVFVPHTRYHIIDQAPGHSFSVRELFTGEVLFDLPSELRPSTAPSISPDGQLVVAGAWDDPEDSTWSRDFIIWDLRTREVVYQTPRYRSVWGRNTTGREVFPQFSFDGKYVIVAKEKAVEIWLIR